MWHCYWPDTWRMQPLMSALPFVQGSGAPKDLASGTRPRRVAAEHAMAAIASDATTWKGWSGGTSPRQLAGAAPTEQKS